MSGGGSVIELRNNVEDELPVIGFLPVWGHGMGWAWARHGLTWGG
jgi:hypothetical protein